MLLPSTFTSRLNTNYVPSDSEIEEIRAALAEPLQQLAVLDERIAQMQAALDAVIAERASLKDEINLHKALISPFRRIPQDILEEIFISCLPIRHNALVNAREAPLLLGHVCSYWRAVSHSMPMLWTSLHIPWATPAPDSIPKFAEMIRAWLGRSANSQLSLSITYSGIQSTIEESLLAEFYRLRHLELGVHSGMNGSMIREDSGPEFWSNIDLLRVGSLREISLHLRADPMRLPLPWAQLTHLDLSCYMTWPANAGDWEGGLRSSEVVEILRRCERLVKCSLHITPVDTFQCPPSATAPELQSLFLTESAEIPQVLDCLYLPSLQHLRLAHHFASACDKDHFLRAVGRHTDFLTSVDLTTLLFSSDTLTEFFRLVPRLRRLCLRLGSGVGLERTLVDDSLLSQLIPTPSSAGFCPLLAEVEFDLCAAFSDDLLYDFIRARMNSPHPLELVDVEFEREKYRDIAPELEPFIVSGRLRLFLEYTMPDQWRYRPREGLSMLSAFN
ncbi:hypothetical protein C8R43DRAFT_1237889 [Mycena crocata]|nr:hypothetical protein C8R43DRAFT_1237889 [Mycena crocata]